MRYLRNATPAFSIVTLYRSRMTANRATYGETGFAHVTTLVIWLVRAPASIYDCPVIQPNEARTSITSAPGVALKLDYIVIIKPAI